MWRVHCFVVVDGGQQEQRAVHSREERLADDTSLICLFDTLFWAAVRFAEWSRLSNESKEVWRGPADCASVRLSLDMWRLRQMNWVCKMSISLESFTRYLMLAMACTLRWTMLYWRQDGIVLGRMGVRTCRQVARPTGFASSSPVFFFLRFLHTSSLAYTLLQVCIVLYNMLAFDHDRTHSTMSAFATTRLTARPHS
jgi:hypothetical protein